MDLRQCKIFNNFRLIKLLKAFLNKDKTWNKNYKETNYKILITKLMPN